MIFTTLFTRLTVIYWGETGLWYVPLYPAESRLWGGCKGKAALHPAGLRSTGGWGRSGLRHREADDISSTWQREAVHPWISKNNKADNHATQQPQALTGSSSHGAAEAESVLRLLPHIKHLHSVAPLPPYFTILRPPRSTRIACCCAVSCFSRSW